MKRLIVTIVLMLLALVIVRVVELAVFPVVSMDIGVRQLEDSNTIFQELQAFEWSKMVFTSIVLSVTGLSVLLVWWKPIKKVLGGK